MIPIAINPELVRVAVAGNGALALRRLRTLRAAGAKTALLFSPAPTLAEQDEAGPALRRHLPMAADLARLNVLWVVGLPADQAAKLAQAARHKQVLVNVEDVTRLCDFHSVAELRRGALLLTVSTSGAAPGLAAVIRRDLEARYGPEWAERVEDIRRKRRQWQQQAVPIPEAARRINDIVETAGWLK